jgi:IS30 family transposase
MHNNKNTFKIEARRRKVASMLSQSMTETEIAEELNIDQSTICRDVRALEEMSQQFVFDLAKSDFQSGCVNPELLKRSNKLSKNPEEYENENEND